MADTKQWRAADGRLQPGFQTAGFTLKQVGKLQALGARHCILNMRKAGRPCFISEIKIQTGVLDFLSDTASG